MEGDDPRNCYNLPLPYERAGDISAQLNTSIRLTSTSIIALISNKTIVSEDLSAVHLGQMLVQNNANASKIAHIKLNKSSYEDWLNNLCDAFNAKKIKSDFWNNAYYFYPYYTIPSVGVLGAERRDFIMPMSLAAYVHTVMGKYNKRKYEKIYASIKDEFVTGTMINAENTFLIDLSFVWAYVGTRKPIDALLPHKTYYIQSFVNADVRCCNISLESEISEIEFLLYDPTLMECLIKIHKSNFFYLHDQYREIAVREGGINSRDGWKKLQLPEYYIQKNSKDKGYDIIRYSSSYIYTRS